MDKRYLFVSLGANFIQFFIYFQISQLNVDLSERIVQAESARERCRENLENAEETLAFDFQQPKKSLMQNPLRAKPRIPDVFSAAALRFEGNAKYKMEDTTGCSCSIADITNEEAQG